MKKRLLAALVSLCMVVGMLPGLAWADETTGTDLTQAPAQTTPTDPPAAELQEQCSYSILCTEDTINPDCSVCAADLSACTGATPAACSCETRCVEGSANSDCPVCAAEGADLSACTGAAPAACSCETRCAEGSVNGDCPVCSAEGAELDKVCVGAAPMPPVTDTSGNANDVLGQDRSGEDYGSMTLTVPEKLDKKSRIKDIYWIPGTAVFTMSSNLSTLLQAQKPENMTLTVELNSELMIDVSKVTLTSDVLEASDIKYEQGVLTLTCTLKEGWETAENTTTTLNWTGTLDSWKFTEGGSLETKGAFQATVPGDSTTIQVLVSATPATTKMSNDVIITAADVIVYMGGDHGYEGVVSDGTIVGSNSLPEPGFYISIPEGWIESWLYFKESATGNTWNLETYDGTEYINVYKIVPASGQDRLQVQFTNTAGETVTSDQFDVGDAVNQTLEMDIDQGFVRTITAMIDYGHGQQDSTEVVTVPGTLTVRGTTANVQYSALNRPAAAGKPAVTAPEGTTFTINDSNVQVVSDDGVALLFDDIIESTQSESNRKDLMEDKVNEVLKDVTVPAGKTRAYEMKYLDLVDTQNGNVWVKASGPVTVSWPYPEGTDQNTEFTLLHFENLNRDMAADAVADAIANATVTPVTVTNTETHIEFTTNQFSPYVLVWNDGEAIGPSEPEENKGGSTGNTDTSSGLDTPADPVYDFWNGVRQRIRDARPGDTLQLSVPSGWKVPSSVLRALADQEDLTLRLRWQDGDSLTLTSQQLEGFDGQGYFSRKQLAQWVTEPAAPQKTAAQTAEQTAPTPSQPAPQPSTQPGGQAAAPAPEQTVSAPETAPETEPAAQPQADTPSPEEPSAQDTPAPEDTPAQPESDSSHALLWAAGAVVLLAAAGTGLWFALGSRKQ